MNPALCPCKYHGKYPCKYHCNPGTRLCARNHRGRTPADFNPGSDVSNRVLNP